MKNKKYLMVGLEIMVLSFIFSNPSPPIKISTHPDNLQYSCSWPEIGIDDSQNAYVVWEGNDGNDSEIYWVKIDASGNPGIVQKISTHPDNIDQDDWRPHIRVDGAGNSSIVWMGRDGDDTEIYWVKIDASGNPGIVQKISTHSDNIEHGGWTPQITLDGNGNSYVVWDHSDGKTYNIYWTKIDPSGNQSDIKKISTHPDNVLYSEYDALVEVGPSGDVFVVYYGYDGPVNEEAPEDQKIYWTKLDQDGNVKIVKKITDSPGIIREERNKFSFTIDKFENSYIAWGAYSGDHADIYLEKIDPLGNCAPVQKISNYPVNNVTDGDRFPFMDTDEEGNCYIVWQCFVGDDVEIYWNRVDPLGVAGTPVKLSTYFLNELFSDFCPQIDVDPQGNSYVVWIKDNDVWGEGHRSKIVWAKIDKNGHIGKVRDISDRKNTACEDSNPQIAVDSSGVSYVVWSGPDESGSDFFFFMKYVESSSLANIMIVGCIICLLIGGLIIIAKKRKNLIKDI